MFNKPWIDGSLEILDLAIEQYFMASLNSDNRISNKYLRTSLITADDAVELGTKGFIELELNETVKQHFTIYDLFSILTQIEPYKSNQDFKTIIKMLKYYHKQRNQLYHNSYSPSMSRLQVQTFLFCILSYFRLLYEGDFDISLQNEEKRRFVFSFIESEYFVTALSKKKGVIFDDSFSFSDLLISLKGLNLINEESRQFFEQVNEINEKLTPSLSELLNLYDVSITFPDEIKKLKDETT